MFLIREFNFSELYDAADTICKLLTVHQPDSVILVLIMPLAER